MRCVGIRTCGGLMRCRMCGYMYMWGINEMYVVQVYAGRGNNEM